MKARVFVTLKTGVLDPQGQAVMHAAASLGYEEVKGVRQGKYFEIELDSVENAEERMKKLSDQLLANPIIEDFRVEVED